MDAEPNIARIAQTIGEPTRIRMLTLLMDGRALTAKELAYGSGVTPATGTAHLGKLLAEALLVCRSQGRYKYFQLASAQVARCIESLLVIAAPSVPAAPRSEHPLRHARFCYDHLAGTLGTRIMQVLLERKLLRVTNRTFEVTARGERWFAGLGIDLPRVVAQRRSFAHACLDWSERKDHLGGALGAALAQHMLDARWLRRRPGTRAVAITDSGRKALGTHFGFDLA